MTLILISRKELASFYAVPEIEVILILRPFRELFFDVLLARFRPNRFFSTAKAEGSKKRRRLPRPVKDLVDRKRRGSDHRPVSPEERRGGQTMGGLENNVSRFPD